MKKAFLISGILLISIMGYSQSDSILSPKLENLKWLSGNWQGEAFGGIVEENWSDLTGGSMMATFKLIVDDKVKFYEIEIIRETEDGIALQLKHFNHDLTGWETQDETVDFPLKYITKDKVVFEGMTFEKISENKMNVSVNLAQPDGSVKVLTINYTK